MLERKFKVLDELNAGLKIRIGNDNYKTYGYNSESDMIEELKQMKKDGVISFTMIENKMWKDEIKLSTIKITELGKEIINDL